MGVDDRVVPLLREELLRGACDRHPALPFLLLAVHVEGEGKGGLAKALSLSLQLLELALGDAAELEQQPARGGTLAAVDMAADHDGEVLLLRVRKRHGG